MTSKSLLVVAALTLTLAVATSATATPPEAEARPAPTATMTAKKKCKAFPPGCVIYFNKRETKVIQHGSIATVIAMIGLVTRNPVAVGGAAFAAPILIEQADSARRKGYCVKASFKLTGKPKVGRYKGRKNGCR